MSSRSATMGTGFPRSSPCGDRPGDESGGIPRRLVSHLTSVYHIVWVHGGYGKRGDSEKVSYGSIPLCGVLHVSRHLCGEVRQPFEHIRWLRPGDSARSSRRASVDRGRDTGFSQPMAQHRDCRLLIEPITRHKRSQIPKDLVRHYIGDRIELGRQ